jgi:hypothetical protein
MASNSETGHAKNIANFFGLNAANSGLGAAYNPSNALYVQATMVLQHTACNNLQGAVNTQKGIFEPFQNARVDTFKPVKPFVRKVRSIAKTSGASSEFVKDVNTRVNKLLGVRISKAKPTDADPSGTSASQQSFDMIVDNFDALVKILAAEPLYAPNEVEYQVVTLTAMHTALDTANKNVKTYVVPYNNAVTARNKALYTTGTGLCDVGQGSKDYTRGAKGYSSPEFKSVVKFKFKKLVKVD